MTEANQDDGLSNWWRMKLEVKQDEARDGAPVRGQRCLRDAESQKTNKANPRDRHQSRRPRSRLLRWLRHHRCGRAQDGAALDHGGAWGALPHPHHPAADEGDRRARIRAASPRRSAGRAAAASATSGWRRPCSKRTPGAATSSTRRSTPRCWPRRSASSKASPTPRARRSTGSTATPPSAISSTSPRASLNHEQLQQLSEEVGPERSLLVACGSFRASADAYPNLTVKKIPRGGAWTLRVGQGRLQPGGRRAAGCAATEPGQQGRRAREAGRAERVTVGQVQALLRWEWEGA